MEQKITHKLYRDTGLLYRFYEMIDENGVCWGTGMENMPDADLLALYDTDPETAMKDRRCADLVAAREAAESGAAE